MDIKQLKDYGDTYKEQFVNLQKYCFQHCDRNELASQWDKFSKESGEVFGILENEVLASSLIVLNYQMYFHGQLIPMGGIGGVTTAPTYRNKGVCSDLIKHALEYMYKQGIVFSSLAPFMHEFYEKFGYKWCYTRTTYEMNINLLKGIKSSHTIVPIDSSNSPKLYDLHEKLIPTYNGLCSRTPSLWESKLTPDTYAIISENTSGSPTGYILYTINSKTLCFEVKEIIYESYESLKSFLHFIYGHSAQVNKVILNCLPDSNIIDALSNPTCNHHISSSMMGRIIDVQKALSYYPFKNSTPFVMKVTDTLCPWNDGCFKISSSPNVSTLTKKTNDLPDFEINIKELSQLIFGFRTFDQLLKCDRLKLTNPSFDYANSFSDKPHPIGIYDYF